MTIEHIAGLLTKLISAQDDITHMNAKGSAREAETRELIFIRNGYRHDILTAFAEVEQQRDDLLATVAQIDTIGAGVPFVETGSPSAMSERLFRCREIARAAIARDRG